MKASAVKDVESHGLVMMRSFFQRSALLIVLVFDLTFAASSDSTGVLLDPQRRRPHVKVNEARDSSAGDQQLKRILDLKVVAPIPMPIVSEIVKVDDESVSLIGYDISDAMEFMPDCARQSVTESAVYLPGYCPNGKFQDAGGPESNGTKNFSDLYLIDHPEDFPWSVNVKISVTFPSGTSFGGSGALIDALHVLTAGHLVYDPDEGGWATSLSVLPGYEDFSEPYGAASATTLFSWTGWTSGGSHEWDMGYAVLDRPVGALSGWHGFGYNDDGSFFQNNTFNNPGYPGEGPYDGQYLYNWLGTYDEVYTHLLYIWKEPYAGQSGSGAYTFVGSDRVVYAVASHKRGSWPFPVNAGYCRINADRFNDIVCTISMNTPAGYDLMPMDVNASPNFTRAGESLTSLNYLIHNYSSASFAGTIPVDVYLSTDVIISTGDLFLQERQESCTLGPKASQRFAAATSLPTIPLNLAPGFYWIGVVLDIVDSDIGNNASLPEDVARIRVDLPNPPEDSPTGLSATDDHCLEIQVCWSDVTRESCYHVYRDGVLAGVTAADETCFNDNVSPGTYHYFVKAYNNGGEGPPSNTDAGTSLNLPPQVDGLGASVGVCDRVYLFWNDVAGEDGYHIYRNDNPIGSVGANVTGFQDLSGLPYVTYNYKVDAYNACTNGAASDPASGYRSGPPGKVPAAAASDGYCDRVVVSWSDVEHETIYRVYRDGQHVGGDRPANSTSYIYYPSVCGTWQFTVRAVNSCGLGEASDANAGTRVCPPGQVEGVTATDDLCGRVVVTWQDANGESGYKVLRDGIEIANVSANTVAYTDNVTAGTYIYNVIAYNGCDGGPASDSDPGTSVGEIGQVQNLTATDDRYDGVLVSWDNLAGEQGYRVYRNDDVVCETSQNVNSCFDEPAPGSYSYTVLAFNACGEGPIAAPDSGCRLPPGDPQIHISADSVVYTLPQGVYWEFGDWPYVDSLWVVNLGVGPLFPIVNNDSMPTHTTAGFVPPIDAQGIHPGDSAKIVIEFRHEFYSSACDGFRYSTPGTYKGSLAVLSNDPSAPVVMIRVVREVPDPGVPWIEITYPLAGDTVPYSPCVGVLADYDAFHCRIPEMFGAASYGADETPVDSIEWWSSPWSVRFYPSQQSDSCRLVLCLEDILGREACDTTGYFSVVCGYCGPIWYVSMEGDDQTGSGALASPFATIQRAIDISKTGDTVLILPGTYVGEGNRNLTVVDKNLVIMGRGGADSTVVDVQDHTSRGFNLLYPLNPTIELVDVKIINASEALYITSAKVVIRNCVISQNVEGIAICDDGSAEVINSIVSENMSHGVSLNCSMPSCTISNCQFVDNAIHISVTDLGPARASITCYHTDFVGGGQGVYACEHGGVFDSCNFIRVGLALEGNNTLTNCVIRDGMTGIVAGECHGRSYNVSNCTFENLGGTVLGARGTVNNSIIRDNSGPIAVLHGGGDPEEYDFLDIHNSLITDNAGGMTINGYSVLQMTGTQFARNIGSIHFDGYSPELVSSFESCTIALNYQAAISVGNSVNRRINIDKCILAFCDSGIVVDTSTPPPLRPIVNLSCTDVFGNSSGDYFGILDQTGQYNNISANPLFCHAASGDFHLRESSPCAPDHSSCSVLIGSLGIGCFGYTCGDADGSSDINIADAVYLVAYIFTYGPAPSQLEAGDADCSGDINISDVVYLIAYIFSGGLAPCAGCK